MTIQRLPSAQPVEQTGGGNREHDLSKGAGDFWPATVARTAPATTIRPSSNGSQRVCGKIFMTSKTCHGVGTVGCDPGRAACEAEEHYRMPTLTEKPETIDAALEIARPAARRGRLVMKSTLPDKLW